MSVVSWKSASLFSKLKYTDDRLNKNSDEGNLIWCSKLTWCQFLHQLLHFWRCSTVSLLLIPFIYITNQTCESSSEADNLHPTKQTQLPKHSSSRWIWIIAVRVITSLRASDVPTNTFNVRATQLLSLIWKMWRLWWVWTHSVCVFGTQTLNYTSQCFAVRHSRHRPTLSPMKAAQTSHYPPIKPLATLNGGRSPGALW